MAVASFEELCAGFCEIAKVPIPALAADAQGRIAFHVTSRGATVNLVHCPQVSDDHVFVLFELGPVGESRDELQALLDANFSSLQVHPPMFSRNPATGDAVLQYTYPFFEANANDLYELIEEGAQWVGHWREDLDAGEKANGQQTLSTPPVGLFHQIA
jgi:hypothetical protein